MNFEHKHIVRYQRIVLISAAILLLLLISLFFKNIFSSEWKQVQKDFAHISAAQTMAGKIKQVTLPHFDRIDRCMTCHNGLQNPQLLNVPQPHTTHPGQLLQHHPIQQFGCTICHGGQGQALDRKNAFALHRKAGWDKPLIAAQHLQSACGTCHLAIYSDNAKLAGTDIFVQGRHIFRQQGCLGCHQARGVGGALGPDLSTQGAKKQSEYNFQNINGESSVSNWLREHFKDPETVSPGSQMLAVALDSTELDALITFTLGLQKPEIPLDFFSIETLQELKSKRDHFSGEQTFQMICSACHGQSGAGKSYKQYKVGVPAILNKNFNATTSSNFLFFTLQYGRNNRQMAGWQPRFSGLASAEIAKLVDYIRGRHPQQSTWSQVVSLAGNRLQGAALYKQNCRTCHGDNGKAFPSISIKNKSMLAAASDKFLYKTLVNGRSNTAMPRWKQFTSQNIADLISHLRNGQPPQQRHSTISIAAANSADGDSLYHFLCSRCHGNVGQGNTGPAIFNREFSQTASDYFLTEMIAKGRSGTAMFGWQKDMSSKEQLSDRQIEKMIRYIRHAGNKTPQVIYPGATFGSAETGRQLFQSTCTECHGTSAEGKSAPALNNQQFLNAATNGFLVAILTLGRNETEMPAWGDATADSFLSIEQRFDLAAFIRTFQQVVITNKMGLDIHH